MNITELHIQNFKGFEDKLIKLDKHVTVLVGNNGKGKTSVLDAISFVLGTFFLGVDGISSYSLKESDKRKVLVGKNSVEVKLPLKIAVNHTFENTEYSWFRSTDKAKGGITTRKDAQPLINRAKELTKNVCEGIPADLPLLVYYGTERLSGEKHEKNAYAKESSRLDGYKDALDRRLSQKRFMKWFKTTETALLQPSSDQIHEQKLYTAFVNTISSMVNDWKNIHFNLKQDDIVGQLDSGEWKQFSLLSDGYRNIIMLCADIAYRAIQLNPHLEENAVLETKGVVLIDEIDMHLHPKWQKSIVNDLKQTFPNIQFVLTTHSPFIVQSLKANEVFNLDDNLLDVHPNSLSLEENALYMGVKNTRSIDFKENEENAFNYLTLLGEEKSDEILEKLNELISKTTDPVFKAKLRFERLAKFGVE